MNSVLVETFTNAASFLCFAVGAIFWLWGSAPLLRPSEQSDSILFNLHTLSVSDTLGSMSIIVGLLFKLPREWPLLLLALFSLAIWNTVLSYVLAYCYYAGRDTIDKYGVDSDVTVNNGTDPNGTDPNGTDPNGIDPMGPAANGGRRLDPPGQGGRYA